MKTRVWMPAFIAALVYTLLDVESAWAWGPATHIQIGADALRNLAVLPTAVAAVLGRYAIDYLYGNVAADVVFAKRWSRVKQFCHHWTTGFRLLNDAPDDRSRSFALGYLSHLAADTIAHGKFIPRQLAITRCSLQFGHLYWEMRADNLVDQAARVQLGQLSTMSFDRHHVAMGRLLTETFLPHEVNLRLFRRMSRLLARERWGRSMQMWDRFSRWELSQELLAQYRRESLGRVLSVLSDQQRSPVLYDDPNGTSALANVRLHRRHVRRLRRRGLALDHILLEAAASHAPEASSDIAAA